jgi:hypothetical protein
MSIMTAQADPAVISGSAVPARLLHRRMKLAAGTCAAATAAAAVRSAISEWRLPSDGGLGSALASDLVISALLSGDAPLILSVQYSASRLRVEVRSQSPAREEHGTGPDAVRGLSLAAAAGAESGCYRTPAGLTVFFALALPFASSPGTGHQPERKPPAPAGDAGN